MRSFIIFLNFFSRLLFVLWKLSFSFPSLKHSDLFFTYSYTALQPAAEEYASSIGFCLGFRNSYPSDIFCLASWVQPSSISSFVFLMFAITFALCLYCSLFPRFLKWYSSAKTSSFLASCLSNSLSGFRKFFTPLQTNDCPKSRDLAQYFAVGFFNRLVYLPLNVIGVLFPVTRLKRRLEVINPENQFYSTIENIFYWSISDQWNA